MPPPEADVKLCPADEDPNVLCRSAGRVQKEQAVRRRALRALVRDLIKLKRVVSRGRLKDVDAIAQRIGTLKERHRSLCRYLKQAAF